MARLAHPAVAPAGAPTPDVHGKTGMEKVLDVVERVGNKVPHPVVIFVILIGIVILLSHLFYLMGARVTYQAIDPATDQLKEFTTPALIHKLVDVAPAP